MFSAGAGQDSGDGRRVNRAGRVEAGLVGAFVADAAALGFHWLYDPDRIAALAGDDPAFRTPDAADFEGFKGVFVHPGKRTGALSQYGEQLRVAIRSMLATGGTFNVADFQDRFVETFGAGGSWGGYMDKATKGTLENLTAGRSDPSGADDDQLPAVAKLPAVMANPNADDTAILAAIRTTNANETAEAFGPAAAAMLRAAYDGGSAHDALEAAEAASPPDVRLAIRAARETPQTDSVIYAGEVGRACPLPQAIPVIAHILTHASDFRDAVERNIRAGGDNCGRGIILGAVFAASTGIVAIPDAWTAHLEEGAALRRDAAALAKMTG